MAMEPNDSPKPLPKNKLNFSKGMVALSVLFVAVGVALMMGPWTYALMAGVTSAALGLGLFFTAGYYWGCDNETCS
jgi:hypothetical protein